MAKWTVKRTEVWQECLGCGYESNFRDICEKCGVEICGGCENLFRLRVEALIPEHSPVVQTELAFCSLHAVQAINLINDWTKKEEHNG